MERANAVALGSYQQISAQSFHVVLRCRSLYIRDCQLYVYFARLYFVLRAPLILVLTVKGVPYAKFEYLTACKKPNLTIRQAVRMRVTATRSTIA